MLLYHFSDTQYSKLTPQQGKRRHKGEDPKAVDEPAIWLTPDPESIPPTGDKEPIYRHEVEIEVDDPNLHKDEKLEDLTNKFEKFFNRKANHEYYFYLDEIEVKDVAVWDEEKKEYQSNN